MPKDDSITIPRAEERQEKVFHECPACGARYRHKHHCRGLAYADEVRYRATRRHCPHRCAFSSSGSQRIMSCHRVCMQQIDNGEKSPDMPCRLCEIRCTLETCRQFWAADDKREP